jgi:hypothetical protein
VIFMVRGCPLGMGYYGLISKAPHAQGGGSWLFHHLRNGFLE